MQKKKLPADKGFIYFYSILSALLMPVWRLLLKRRMRSGKETPESVSQRCLEKLPDRPKGKLIWGHAVGVGEALSLLGLMRKIHQDHVKHRTNEPIYFLITTTARTSKQALSQQKLEDCFIHQFMPVDTPYMAKKFIAHWQPDLAIWCELDLWPALIDQTYRHGVPMFLINVRTSEQSFQKKRRATWLYHPLFQRFSEIWVQNTFTKHALITLGADEKKVRETGTIKAFIPPLSVNDKELTAWKPLGQKRHIWLLASSHDPEEALALDAHAIIRETFPNALLIIVPRIPLRHEEILKKCEVYYKKNEVMQRSVSRELPDTQPVYLADTMGELGLWYRLASVAMVGGSWADVGGHNPYEAVACGCEVLHGSYIYNFSESYEQLNASKHAYLCNDAKTIAQRVTQQWKSHEELDNVVNPMLLKLEAAYNSLTDNLYL